MSSRTTSRTGSRGFTLIELLVTIAIIAVLAGLLLAALSIVRGAARRRQAHKEVMEIAGALKTYYITFHAYPPDTEDWGSRGGYDERKGVMPVDRDVDQYSIYRYLGTDRVTKRGHKVTAQMGLKEDRLADLTHDIEGNELGKYVDPWGTPFHIDCVHMYFDNNKEWKQKGWPYRRTGGDEPSDTERKRFITDAKVVSYGPDMVSQPYPFEAAGAGYEPRAADDLRSW